MSYWDRLIINRKSKSTDIGIFFWTLVAFLALISPNLGDLAQAAQKKSSEKKTSEGAPAVFPSIPPSNSRSDKPDMPADSALDAELAAPLPNPGVGNTKRDKQKVETDGAGNKVKTRRKKVKKNNEVITTNEKITETKNRFTGFTLFLGVDTGYQWSTPSDAAIETKKTGYYLAGKLLGSFYPGSFAIDIGGGWLFSQTSGQEYNGKRDPNQEPFLEKVTVISQAGLLEMAARMRLSETVQLGVAINGAVGADMSFSSIPASSNFAVFGAAQLVLASTSGTSDLRYLLQFMADITVPQRQIYWAMFGFQFGVPFSRPDILTTERNIDSLRTKHSIKVEERQVFFKTVKEVGKYVLNQQEVAWEEDKDATAQLTVEAQTFLIDLGNGLDATKDLWKEMVIEGHVDQQESPAKTLRLSRNRAEAVRSALISVGIPSEKIKIKPMGNSVPRVAADPEGKSPQNQRIELVFAGVTNYKKLSDAITNKVRKTVTPDTCDDQNCK